jgi:hypothetical protein
MFVDLFLRFMWVLTLVPPQSGATFELPSYLSAVTMTLELIRRTLWGFFRLEVRNTIISADERMCPYLTCSTKQSYI